MRYILGRGGYYIAFYPLFAKRGGMAIYSQFSGGGDLLYRTFSAYPGKGEWLWGENGSITPVDTIRFVSYDLYYKIIRLSCTHTKINLIRL